MEKSDFTEKFFLDFEKSNGVPDSMRMINKRFRQGSQEGEFGRTKTPKIGNRKIGKKSFWLLILYF